MADISITAASVFQSVNGSGGELPAAAGVTITAGKALSLTALNTLALADSDGTTPANSFHGIALNGGGPGQPIKFVNLDPAFIFGGTGLAGDDVWLSDTPGGITSTKADLESGDLVTHLGVLVTTTTLNLKPCIGGQIA